MNASPNQEAYISPFAARAVLAEAEVETQKVILAKLRASLADMFFAASEKI